MANLRLKRRLAGGNLGVPDEPTGATTVFAAPLPDKAPKTGLGLTGNIGEVDLSIPGTPNVGNVLQIGAPQGGGLDFSGTGGGGGAGRDYFGLTGDQLAPGGGGFDISKLLDALFPGQGGCPPGQHPDEFNGTCVDDEFPKLPPLDGDVEKDPNAPCPPGTILIDGFCFPATQFPPPERPGECPAGTHLEDGFCVPDRPEQEQESGIGDPSDPDSPIFKATQAASAVLGQILGKGSEVAGVNLGNLARVAGIGTGIYGAVNADNDADRGGGIATSVGSAISLIPGLQIPGMIIAALGSLTSFFGEKKPRGRPAFQANIPPDSTLGDVIDNIDNLDIFAGAGGREPFEAQAQAHLKDEWSAIQERLRKLATSSPDFDPSMLMPEFLSSRALPDIEELIAGAIRGDRPLHRLAPEFKEALKGTSFQQALDLQFNQNLPDTDELTGDQATPLRRGLFTSLPGGELSGIGGRSLGITQPKSGQFALLDVIKNPVDSGGDDGIPENLKSVRSDITGPRGELVVGVENEFSPGFKELYYFDSAGNKHKLKPSQEFLDQFEEDEGD